MDKKIKFAAPEKKTEKKFQIKVEQLADFDMAYFKKLEGESGWIALDYDNCKNCHYFTAHGENNKKLGIVGVYDTEQDKNLLHYVVDPDFRGQGLARKFTDQIMAELDLSQVILTIDLDNTSSLKAATKFPGVKRVSDKKYEDEFHKAKFIYERSHHKKDS